MVARSDGGERRHKRHSEVLTGDRWQPLATMATRPPELPGTELPGTELLGEKLKSWGVPPDDLTVDAVRRRMAKIQLSIEDQFWLLETAERKATIHLRIEGEVEVVQGLVRVAEGGLFAAPVEQPIAAPGQLIGDQARDQIDGRHGFSLGLVQSGFQH